MQLFTYTENNFYTNFPSLLGESIKILMIGDVVGRPGRQILKKVLPQLKSVAQIDFVTVNGENLAGGFGITEKIYDELVEEQLSESFTIQAPNFEMILRTSLSIYYSIAGKKLAPIIIKGLK